MADAPATLSDQLADMAGATTTEWLCVRPGACVLDSSADQLLIAFPNYTVTFSSPQVTQGVRSLLAILQRAHTRSETMRVGAETSELDPNFIGYLIDLLLQTNCLYRGSSPAATQPLEDASVTDFFAYLGEDPASTKAACGSQTLLVVLPSSINDDFTRVIHSSGLNAELIPISPGTSCDVALSQAEERLDSGCSMMVSWNFPYRLPFSRLLNELAIRKKKPILFGACEGAVARIGPYVIPENTACLECCNSRLLAHAGAAELQAFKEYRGKYRELIPPPWPTHPLFHDGVERLFVIELSLIVMKYPPRTIGGFIEHSFFDSSVQRHAVYKIPRCPACYPSRPQRFAWDARFAAPAVKNNPR